MKTIHCLTFFLLFCCSCKSGQSTKEQATDEKPQNVEKSFKLPEMPQMYTTPEQRADFLIKHYWDLFDFTDTTYIHLPNVTEQAYVDFLDITNHTTPESAREGMKRFMNGAEKNKTVFDYFVSLNDKYLYDPNSPFRNEELYIVALERMIETDLLDETEKTRPKYRLKLAQNNRVGTKALNFTYTVASGKQGTLYGLSTEYLIIYINNPGCHACEEITEGLKQSRRIEYLLSEKRLTILCIYPDEELDEWEKHQSDFPSHWINGYDKGTVIRQKDLYDLKAIPSLYLLDKHKNVLLKDATLPAIEMYNFEF